MVYGMIEGLGIDSLEGGHIGGRLRTIVSRMHFTWDITVYLVLTILDEHFRLKQYTILKQYTRISLGSSSSSLYPSSNSS